jgi:uncharacterized membrane protein YphA (DoxX/SURF4 family)
MTAGSVLILCVRGGLAVILIAAGAAKLASLTDFSSTLAQLSGISISTGRRVALIRSAAKLLAAGELASGLASLTGAIPRAIDAAVVALTLAFAIVAVYGFRTHSMLECRCFGSLTASRFGRGGVARAVALLGAAVVVLAVGAPEGVAWRTSPGAAAAIATLGILFGLCCATATRTIDTAGARRRALGAQS